MPIACAVVAQAWNAVSRSWRRYFGASSHGNASRSCWAVHAAVGWSVTAMCTTRRRSCARITSTNKRRQVAVGTTKKSAAASCWAWFARNVRHVCDGGCGTAHHVLRDGSLTDVETQFQQLTVNPRCTPQRIGLRHVPNQCADIGRHAGPSDASSTLPRPPQAKPLPMPREDRLRLDDDERRSPGWPRLRKPRPKHPINAREAKPWTAGTIHQGQLVPKREDLQVHCRTRANQEPE